MCINIVVHDRRQTEIGVPMVIKFRGVNVSTIMNAGNFLAVMADVAVIIIHRKNMNVTVSWASPDNTANWNYWHPVY